VRPRRICDIYDFFAPHINVLTYLLTYHHAQMWARQNSSVSRPLLVRYVVVRQCLRSATQRLMTLPQHQHSTPPSVRWARHDCLEHFATVLRMQQNYNWHGMDIWLFLITSEYSTLQIFVAMRPVVGCRTKISSRTFRSWRSATSAPIQRRIRPRKDFRKQCTKAAGKNA